jgi:hypothetical protein
VVVSLFKLFAKALLHLSVQKLLHLEASLLKLVLSHPHQTPPTQPDSPPQTPLLRIGITVEKQISIQPFQIFVFEVPKRLNHHPRRSSSRLSILRLLQHPFDPGHVPIQHPQPQFARGGIVIANAHVLLLLQSFCPGN